MAAVVPVAMMVASYVASRRAQKKAAERSKEEQAALQGAQTSAQQIQQTGQNLVGTGSPMQTQAANYYQTLLRGSRPAMAQATAAPTAAITDIYRGAERNLDRAGVQGAARDVAVADLGRQRAGQIAGLTTGVQPAAAGELAGIGGQMTGQGVGALQGAGGLYSDLLGQGARNRMYARQEGEKAGSQWGRLAMLGAQMASSYYGGGGWGGWTGGGGSYPNVPYGPGY